MSAFYITSIDLTTTVVTSILENMGCSGSEYVPSGEIDWVCKNRCEWYRPEIVDAYASDKALWRRRLSMTDLRHKERGEDKKISL